MQVNKLDWRPKNDLALPLENFADIVYLKEQSILHRMRDVCTLLCEGREGGGVTL